MNRRDLFKIVIAASAIPATVVAVETPQAWPTVDQPMEYHGYKIHFTGWIGTQENSSLFGHWRAWPMRGFGEKDVPDRQPYLNLTVPGFIGGPYHPGAHFNLLCPSDRLVSIFTSEDEKDRAVAEGRTYIQQLVDAYKHTEARNQDPVMLQFPLTAQRIHHYVSIEG